VILDACPTWTNLAAEIIMQRLPYTPIIDLAAVSVDHESAANY
jgi:hypothetical protein